MVFIQEVEPISDVASLIAQRIDRAQRWLLSQQLENGSWANSSWHTAKIILALVDTV